MLKCIIVDDEQFAIDALSKYIELMPDMVITDVFTDPLQALISLSSLEKTDVLFMDIDMPGISGLELAKTLRTKTDKLVFTTAHSKYAFDAYEVAGDAYLLKPYNFAKFSTTISRLFAGKCSNDNYSESPNDEYFLVKSKEDDLAIVKVRFNDVVAFESAQNYIRIHLVNDKILTAYLTLKDVLQLLKNRLDFLQLHRAFIVSTDHIDHIKGHFVQMSNQITFSVGEIFREQFSAYLDEKLMVTSRKH